ncbi:hypothetical protein KDX15_23385 [Burkholderia cenocepacia]|uniref:hypothetical protein n=1 Tax=Burkholderia cenocepacia TaxID=95486 RepID=UPI001BA3407B|nr:hypothetical protein [Burkholderia cenocepacia]MBR8276786.1 hypothetical protein [Burkholderia cenocepacia]
MPQILDSAIKAAAKRIDHYIEIHQVHPEISFSDHVKAKRKELASRASAFRLIYLDTNAWRCFADYLLGNEEVTPEMKLFAASLEQAANTGKFAFPIGLPTFFELDSMVDPATRDTVTRLVDELSQGLCIAPSQERIGSELRKLRLTDLQTSEGLEDFLCSPVELLGIPAVSLHEFLKAKLDEATFNKAFFDALAELPFSIQLKVAGSSPHGKWNNSHGIADLNTGKIEHQEEIANLNTGIFVELEGCIAAWFREEGVVTTPQEIACYALTALYHWHQMPSSRALPTLRVLSSLHGLMRLDSKRRYQKGDPNDFMVAASALPVAQALFTADRKLVNLLSDARIGFRNFSDCTIVSSFTEMAKYLDEQR